MITLQVIEKKALKAFKIPFKGIKKAVKHDNGCRTSEARYMIYHIALSYGVTPDELASRYGKSRTNIIYGEMVATNLLTYDRVYQQRYRAIKIEIDNLIINSYEN